MLNLWTARVLRPGPCLARFGTVVLALLIVTPSVYCQPALSPDPDPLWWTNNWATWDDYLAYLASLPKPTNAPVVRDFADLWLSLVHHGSNLIVTVHEPYPIACTLWYSFGLSSDAGSPEHMEWHHWIDLPVGQTNATMILSVPASDGHPAVNPPPMMFFRASTTDPVLSRSGSRVVLMTCGVCAFFVLAYALRGTGV